jgi:hypothetical protein
MAVILQAIASGYVHGYTVMDASDLPSGTVYAALRRLEKEQLPSSHSSSQPSVRFAAQSGSSKAAPF